MAEKYPQHWAVMSPDTLEKAQALAERGKDKASSLAQKGKEKLIYKLTNLRFGGPWYEKYVFFGLFVTSLLLFAVNAVMRLWAGLVSDTEVSQMHVSVLKELEYPAVWVCMETVLATKLDVIPTQASGECTPTNPAGERIRECTADEKKGKQSVPFGGTMGVEVPQPCVWTRSFLLTKNQETSECVAWMRGTPLANQLEQWQHEERQKLKEDGGAQGYKGFMCMVANEGSASAKTKTVVDVERDAFLLDLRWQTNVANGRNLGYMGLAIREKDRYGQVRQPEDWRFHKSKMGLMNAWNDFQLSKDIIDHRIEGYYLEEFHMQTGMYNQKFSAGSAPRMMKKGGSTSRIQIQTATFVSKSIEVRNKRLSEIASEIGGLWSSATLAIALLFMKEVVTFSGDDEASSGQQHSRNLARSRIGGVLAVAYNVYVFRWRGKEQRNQYAKEGVEEYMEKKRSRTAGEMELGEPQRRG